MNSIKTKVLLSYLIIIGGMVLLLAVVLFANYTLIQRYEKISNNIVQEQAISDVAADLPSDVYNGFKTGDYTKYNQRLSDIAVIEKKLDTQLNASESLLAYRGVKNSLKTIVSEIDEVKQKVEQGGDIEGISKIFEEATTKFDYVNENIDDLILIETKNLARVTQELQQTRAITIYILGLIVVVASVGAALYAVVFSAKLTEPVIALSETARRIAGNELNLTVREDLLAMKDEIGSLSTSFNSMVQKLRAKIDEQNAFNELLEKSKKEIEQRNLELERFNKLVVDRELKMVELKKRIAELEQSH
jgi:methyl-accepting chemotaxis protein